jgi:hypothetical protein
MRFCRCALQKYWIFAGCTLHFWRVGSQKCSVFIGAPCKIVEFSQFLKGAPRKIQQFCKARLWKFNNFDCQLSKNESFLKGAPYENSTILTASLSKMNHFWRMHSTRTYLFWMVFAILCNPYAKLQTMLRNYWKTICFCSFWASRSPYAITLTNYQRGKNFWVTDN